MFTVFIGGAKLPKLDPILMFGFFKMFYPEGSSDHPHRGFETSTYIL